MDAAILVMLCFWIYPFSLEYLRGNSFNVPIVVIWIGVVVAYASRMVFQFMGYDSIATWVYMMFLAASALVLAVFRKRIVQSEYDWGQKPMNFKERVAALVSVIGMTVGLLVPLCDGCLSS